MGKRGPPPTPTKVLKLRGSWRGDEREGEPEPPKLQTKCPDWLRPLAQEAWKTLTKQLGALGLLGNVDANSLARYCQTYAKWREAEAFIAEHGQTFEAVEGPRLHPMAALAIKLGEQLVRLEGQFGLTPAARAHLSKPKETPKGGGKERFFGDTG